MVHILSDNDVLEKLCLIRCCDYSEFYREFWDWQTFWKEQKKMSEKHVAERNTPKNRKKKAKETTKNGNLTNVENRLPYRFVRNS